MTTKAHGRPTLYGVWVGDLKENVTESDLQLLFGQVGTVANCTIMRNEQGVSR